MTPEGVAALVRQDRARWGHGVMPRKSSAGFSPWCGLCGRTVRQVPGSAMSWVHA